MTGPIPKILVIDGFLPPALLRALLDHARDAEGSFMPTEVVRSGQITVSPAVRLSAQCSQGLGPHEPAFTAAILARLDCIFAETGIGRFADPELELELVAHGDGAFYARHHDTHTHGDHALVTSDRLISAVFYFFREPQGFSGGELAIYPFLGGDPCAIIAPLQNRLVVFPAHAPHEVQPVHCPSDTFANSRFAINCWLRRRRS